MPDPEEIGIHELQGDGDFRSPECIELLKQADIVVTNPPFSLFREYVAQLIRYGKRFLILGNKNAVTYKEIFPLIRDNLLWIGVTPMSREVYFDVPQSYIDDGLAKKKERTIVVRNGRHMARSPSIWFTNLDHKKRHEELILYKTYAEKDYPSYDNYDAIEVGNTGDIPSDYDGMMGVPNTFLDKYNPDQFEILGITKTWFGMATKTYPDQVQVDKNGEEKKVSKLNDGAVLEVSSPPVGKTYYRVNGRNYIQTYPRILIRRRPR